LIFLMNFGGIIDYLEIVKVFTSDPRWGKGYNFLRWIVSDTLFQFSMYFSGLTGIPFRWTS